MSQSGVGGLARTGDRDALSNRPASAKEKTEQSSDQEETYQLVRLHATTSRYDDWLHRGRWLRSLPYFVYMHSINRVRKAKAWQASKQAPQRFEFDEHYPLSTLYQQEMKSRVIPRLAGTQCKPDEGNQREGYTIWHLVMVGPARCQRPGRSDAPAYAKATVPFPRDVVTIAGACLSSIRENQTRRTEALLSARPR